MPLPSAPVVCITGASAGVGRATALAFAAGLILAGGLGFAMSRMMPRLR